MTTACRNCGSSKLELVLSLGSMPLANALLTDAELDRPEPRFPLELAYCDGCCLVQITESVEPELLFREYAYFSSVSDAFVEHAKPQIRHSHVVVGTRRIRVGLECRPRRGNRFPIPAGLIVLQG